MRLLEIVEFKRRKGPGPAVHGRPSERPPRVRRAHCLAWQVAEMKYLVVDSGPLIKGVRLERFGAERYVTVPEVLGELRDSQARALLESLPFDLELREPSDEAMKAGALRSPVIAPVVHGPIALLISAPMTWRWQ